MKKKAFTLIELLVVIAIIAVLMAILMPALRLARDQAKGLLCVANLRNLSIAWLAYSQDNEGRLVGGWPNHGAPWVQGPTGNHPDPIEQKKQGIKDGLLYPYVKNVDVYRCPADARKNIVHQEAFRTYSIAGGMNGEAPNFEAEEHKLYSRIRSPSEKYVFVAETDPRGWNVGSWVLRPKTRRWVDPLAIWHNDRGTLGFADGHAEKHQWVDWSTIDAARRAVEGDTSVFNWPLRPGEGEDLNYMLMGYAYKKLK